MSVCMSATERTFREMDMEITGGKDSLENFLRRRVSKKNKQAKNHSCRTNMVTKIKQHMSQVMQKVY